MQRSRYANTHVTRDKQPLNNNPHTSNTERPTMFETREYSEGNIFEAAQEITLTVTDLRIPPQKTKTDISANAQKKERFKIKVKYEITQ